MIFFSQSTLAVGAYIIFGCMKKIFFPNGVVFLLFVASVWVCVIQCATLHLMQSSGTGHASVTDNGVLGTV